MAWTREETIRNLIILLLLSFFLAVTSVALVLYNLLGDGEDHEYTTSFLYFIAVTFGTGTGCTCFRIVQAKKTWLHAALHTMVLLLMLIGHRELFQFLLNGQTFHCINKYTISTLTFAIYILQYILSYHFLVFRYGRTRAQRVFRAGVHAFLGALTCFVCVLDGVVNCHRIEKDEDMAPSIVHNMASICILCYGMCTWYLFLNPYFDWRRMRAMLRSPQGARGHGRGQGRHHRHQ